MATALAQGAGIGDRAVRALVFRLVRHVLIGRLRDSGEPLRGRLTRHDIADILDHAATEFTRLAAALPEEPTVGSRLLVRLAAWTLAVDRALQSHTVPAADAHTLAADIAWAAYRPFVAVSSVPARFCVRGSRARVRALLRSQQRFPFNQPGWRFDRIGDEGLAIDMTHCPIAAYLSSQGAADLCVAAWCAQDGPVAEQWGAVLRRTGTLATGARVCDFRYDVARPNRAGRHRVKAHRLLSGRVHARLAGQRK